MHNGNTKTDRALRFEILIIVLFLFVSGFYAFDLIPNQFVFWVLGLVGFIGLVPVAKSAWESLRERKVNVDLLASIALFLSFYEHAWGSLLFINVMLASARILDLYTKRRVSISLESLAKLKPVKARVFRGEQSVEIPLEEVKVGDLVVVNLGEQIPVDGIVYQGSATVDQASLTGESVPILRTVNDRVFSATIVASGNIIVRAQRIGAETTFELMVKLVEASQGEKTRMKTLAERFASWYIGIMLAIAIVLYFFTGGDTTLVLAVVLVVCADDIAIAIPLAYIIAIGTAARRGIIIKSADFLDSAAKIATLIVDKTGTLTLGKLTVKTVYSFGGADIPQVLELACSICNRSSHPVSKAIILYAKENGTVCGAPNNFKEVEGRGIIGASNDNKKIILGRPDFFIEQGIPFTDEVSTSVAKGVAESNNVTLLALDGTVVGLFALADEIRDEVVGTITALKKSGVKEVVMLTGDNEGVAKSIAGRLGIDKYYSKLLPEHKVFVLKEYLGKNGGTVAMVGDGVNDAAVLTRADVGIAMGGIGTDAA
ncbi:MAG: cation-translocating P-type ATPase, partial [Patescibacteria group bacterium]